MKLIKSEFINYIIKMEVEVEELINKIKSKFILNYVFDYIKDTNFKVKLFIHSKSYQKKLDLKLLTYKELFLNKIGFNLDNYLNSDSNENYDNFLLENKINKEEFENMVYEILNKNEIEDINEVNRKEEYNKLIEINSPIFDLISKTKSFHKYSISISQEDIDKNLKVDYIILFNKLNKSNINYTSIYYSFNDITKLKYLNELCIDFNKIKRIILDIKGKDNKIDEDYKFYFITFFSNTSIQNNLSYLKIKSNVFKGITDIYFLENVNFKELKELDLSYNKISYIKVLEKIQFVKLEKLNLDDNEISNIDILENFNFKELKELDLTYNGISDIKVLEKVKYEKLEKLNLGKNKIARLDILENFNFKELKVLNLYLNQISDIKVLEQVKFKKLKN